MKRLIVILLLIVPDFGAYAQLKVRIDIPGNSNTENYQNLRYNRKLIRTSCRLPFYVKDSVTEADIVKALVLTPSSCGKAVALYINDTSRLAILVQCKKKKYEVITYWKNGNTQRIGLYNRNKFETHSIWKYYVTGRMKLKGHYKYGKKNGKWKQYNPDGTISKISFFSYDSLVCSYPSEDSVLCNSKGALALPRIRFWYETDIRASIIIKKGQLVLRPFNSRGYLKNVEIPLVNIKRVTRIGGLLAIIGTRDSNSYIVSFNSWNRGKFIRVLRKTESITIGGAPDKSKNINIQCHNDSSLVSLRLKAYGSLLYTPLNICGCFSRQDSQLIFTPSEFTNYVDIIRIKMSDIESIHQKGKRKVCIKLLTGQKYKFTAHNAALLLSYLKVK